ncbi:MAG: DUF4388 domain-containing protein [Fibrobacter sp.]|nr:DUF4388 domain-containing protein [Fibrobacter sp.]
MVLSGTLREFILADVCQLLAQQKITGKLILNNGRSEGCIVFKNGLIVSAEKNDEKLNLKLFNYLTKFKKLSPNKITDFFSSYEADIHKLSLDIVSHGIIPREIMYSYSEALIEDIVCSLFLWHTGSYRFSSLRNVDHLIPLNISFPVENIVMEAMRRIDEWHRMVANISYETTFVKAQKNPNETITPPDPVTDTTNHIYYLIDGVSPVFEIINDSSLSEYKVFEALNTLLLSKSILPLSDKYSRTVHAAIQQKEKNKKPLTLQIISSILITVAIISVIILFAWFLRNTTHSYLQFTNPRFLSNLDIFFSSNPVG